MIIKDILIFFVLLNLNRFYFNGNKNIIYMHQKNFDTMVELDSKRKFIVFLYKENKCEFCEKFSKIYDRLGERLKIDNSKTIKAAINCTKNDSLCSRFFINFYPSLIYIINGNYYKFSKKHDLENYLLFEDKGYLEEEVEKLLNKEPSSFLVIKKLLIELYKQFKIIQAGDNSKLKFYSIFVILLFIIINLMLFYYLYKVLCKKNNFKFKNN